MPIANKTDIPCLPGVFSVGFFEIWSQTCTPVQYDLTLSLQNLEPFRGSTLAFQNTKTARRLHAWLLQGWAVGLLSWIYGSLNPRWISHHGSLKIQILDFSFLTFPLWQDTYGFCKSKIWAQQMVSIRRKCFLCQPHNHTSPKLPFKSSQGFF